MTYEERIKEMGYQNFPFEAGNGCMIINACNATDICESAFENFDLIGNGETWLIIISKIIEEHFKSDKNSYNEFTRKIRFDDEADYCLIYGDEGTLQQLINICNPIFKSKENLLSLLELIDPDELF